MEGDESWSGLAPNATLLYLHLSFGASMHVLVFSVEGLQWDSL